MSEQLTLDFTTAPMAPRLDLQARLQGLVERFLQDGADPHELARLGWTELITLGHGEVHGTWPSGVRTAFVAGADPIAIATSLAIGQLGILWPMAMPRYLKAVNQAWQARRKGRP